MSGMSGAKSRSTGNIHFLYYVPVIVIIFIATIYALIVITRQSATVGVNGFLPTICAEDLVIGDKFLYLADGPGGIKVIDISNPESPSVVNQIATVYALRIFLDGNTLILCDGPGGFRIYSLDNPQAPEQVFNNRSVWATSAAVFNNRLYVCDYENGLKTFDITNPDRPRQVSSSSRQYWTRDVVANERGVFLSNPQNGLYTFKILESGEPRQQFFHTGGKSTFKNLTDFGNYVLIARSDEATSISVYDITDLNNPGLLTEIFPSRFIEGLTISGNLLIVSMGTEGVACLDLQDVQNPKELLRFDTPTYARAAKISGDHMYIADVSGLLVTEIGSIAVE